MRSFKRLPKPLGALAVLAVLAGCGSSDPDYYTLRAWPGMAQAGGPLSLKIRTPSVAGYLDRDYIVSGDRDYRLRLSKDGAWGEPLADMIGQTLASDLQQRLPGTNVFTQAGAISTEAQGTVELDITQFARTNDGQVVLGGALSVKRAQTGNGPALPTSSIPLHLAMTPDGSGVSAEVAALSQLLGQVADRAAIEARRIGTTLPPAEPPPATDGAAATGVPVTLAPR
ncbi:PqiC family protein [Acetobacteraceae bacterium KSS8]|uniref:PqiC family protein n=1 Tax=Endosaccharibacter trunci TaxID=2812733 RepID=A0ABT1W9W1_9PROT|nr:PqiC family protein [Acetobacteraceae bacterium KSS8]